MVLVRFLLIVLPGLLISPLYAGEGMWLPLLLKQLNEADMRAQGMQMTAEDIYSVNAGSLKDAIVHFGGFCTGEVISDQGLLLTNHHCGFGQIRQHSTMQKNYLQDGFWADSPADELPNPGLHARFIIRMEDVTDKIFEGLTDDMLDRDRQSLIDKNSNRLMDQLARESYQEVIIRPFFEGNQYFAFITETYNDVRLVAAPPNSIGKFGADTDNWVWPRHTGDFSLFRIYAGPDNKPAAYSPDNKPFRPRHSLPISLDGVAPGDFTLVFGFPGSTKQYLPAIAVQQEVELINPIGIDIRTQVLDVMNAAMQSDAHVRLDYASKQARLANSWKKWIGINQGIKATGGLEAKRAFESEFIRRIEANPTWKSAYGKLLPKMNQLYTTAAPYRAGLTYISEITQRNSELFRLAGVLQRYLQLYEENGSEAFQQRKERLTQYLENFYKDYRSEIDQEIFARLMQVYFEQVEGRFQAPYAQQQFAAANKDYNQFTRRIFDKSILLRQDKLLQALSSDSELFVKLVDNDIALQLLRAIRTYSDSNISQQYNQLRDQLAPLQRQYMAALLKVFPERTFYPDANSTLRFTYGKVNGYSPKDAVFYEPVTYLEGVMEKYVPDDYEFDLPEKLIELYHAKDYGPYAAENGQLPICFIGTNHTTGGNSGSPAIDAYGNLIGLNFDRAWEGTMSDFYYDPRICRNIMVDIRYVLFTIDKLGGASWLIDEMQLVHPKKG